MSGQFTSPFDRPFGKPNVKPKKGEAVFSAQATSVVHARESAYASVSFTASSSQSFAGSIDYPPAEFMFLTQDGGQMQTQDGGRVLQES